MNFWFDIQPEDLIIARAGRKRLVGVGTVQGSPYFDPANESLTWGRNFLPVKWDDVAEGEFPLEAKELIPTIRELTEKRFMELTSGLLS